MTLDEILKKINETEKILIVTHESPDGDAIGSALAVKFILQKIGKTPIVLIPKMAKAFEFLPGTEDIVSESEEKFELAISVDCSDSKRIAGRETFEKADFKIVIDHHGTNNMFGDLNFVDPVAPACCQIIAGMCEYYQIKLDKNIATCIIVGLITDTGGFRHKGITPETFEFAADCLRLGVDISSVYNRVLCTSTVSSFELAKIAINRLERINEGKIAFTYTTEGDNLEVGAQTGDHEGIVESGLRVEGVEVSIYLREKELDVYKISMRSKEYVNVSEVCSKFNGGGHIKAAGGLIEDNIENAKERIIAEVKKYLK